MRRGGAARGLDRVLRRLEADLRVVDLLQAVDQLDPLVGLEHRVDPLGGLGVGAVERLPAHVDVVVVVAHRERVVGALEGHQGDDLVGLHGALQGEQALDREVGDRALALVADDRDAVDHRDVDGVAGGVLGDVARGGEEAVAALHRGDRRLEARGGQELERGEHAAVDRAGADVAGAAGVDVDARVGEHVTAQRVLAHQQDLPERGAVGVVAEERVLALGAVDRGRLEQLPAVEDRLRVDARGAAAGRAQLEQDVRGLGRRDLADAAEDRAGDDARALLQRLGDEVAGVEADRGRVRGAEGGLGELRLAARGHARWGARGGRTGAA